ncbi:alpha/beta hydrolase [Sphingomonas sp. OK281]|uniref:alpha/beta hydrolase n=1 Tax=Sphingomonas sp. OK281 TaxID=1881067 RepID=UPI0034A35BAB
MIVRPAQADAADPNEDLTQSHGRRGSLHDIQTIGLLADDGFHGILLAPGERCCLKTASHIYKPALVCANKSGPAGRAGPRLTLVDCRIAYSPPGNDRHAKARRRPGAEGWQWLAGECTRAIAAAACTAPSAETAAVLSSWTGDIRGSIPRDTGGEIISGWRLQRSGRRCATRRRWSGRRSRRPAPTLLTTCENDPLRDESKAYGHRLRDVDITVDRDRCAGMIHAFPQMGGRMDRSNRLRDRIARCLDADDGRMVHPERFERPTLRFVV